MTEVEQSYIKKIVKENSNLENNADDSGKVYEEEKKQENHVTMKKKFSVSFWADQFFVS